MKVETGEAPLVEIMIPLVGFEEELRLLREEVFEAAEERAGGVAASGSSTSSAP